MEGIEAWLSAGDTAPGRLRGCMADAADCVLAVDGLEIGGFIDCFLLAALTAGRGNAAIETGRHV